MDLATIYQHWRQDALLYNTKYNRNNNILNIYLLYIFIYSIDVQFKLYIF